MFEGVVSQVLGGFLRRYVKDFQKKQLKIGIWNEEILLKDVELILEAFEYLQLPFALKNGRIGKLSIKIPWKKLGWDPIIVNLEDVFFCACQREDSEWSSESVDRRELAGKLAKLNAVELAKFSRRVTDNQTGQSFLSYITAKILDSIEVTVKNVHIVYVDTHNDQAKYLFGLGLSSLTILDPQKQSFPASLMGSRRKVNKIIQISNVVLYCDQFEESQDLFCFGAHEDSQLNCASRLGQKDNFLISPIDVNVSVLANKYGKRDGMPQYDISVEMTAVALLLQETQLEQLLSLWDYFTVCALRKKYGRFRPAQTSLSQRVNRWQILWWHYAQNSVLADVRQRMKRTSWRYLGHRLSERHRYVSLYRRKLELLQNDQNANRDILIEILQKLENMDKECDIDDILRYRAIAEEQLQMQDLSIYKRSASGVKDASLGQQNAETGDQSPVETRGWLNWFSLGMLGAGGTAETSSFAGVVSEKIIKDIYEGTEFHPEQFSDGDSTFKERYHSSSIKLSVSQLQLLIISRQSGRQLLNALVIGFDSEYKVCFDSVNINLWIYSFKMTDHCNKTLIMVDPQLSFGDDSLNCGQPVVDIKIQRDLQDSNFCAETAISVVVQNLEAIYEPYAMHDLLIVSEIFSSFQSQGNRVVSSLNMLDDSVTRLISKVMFVSSNRQKLQWDIKLYQLFLKIPLQFEAAENFALALEVDVLSVSSSNSTQSVQVPRNKVFLTNALDARESNALESFLSVQNCDLYDHFDAAITNFQVKIVPPNLSRLFPTVMKFDASISLSLCIILNESALKCLVANFTFPSIEMHLSQAICKLVLNAYPLIMVKRPSVNNIQINSGHVEKKFSSVECSLKVDKLTLDIDLVNAEQKSVINLMTENMDVRYVYSEIRELLVSLKMIGIFSYDGVESKPLCISRVYRDQNICCKKNDSAEGCLILHHETKRDESGVHSVNLLIMTDMDLHIHPRIVGQLQEFLESINSKSELSYNRENYLQNKRTGSSEVDKFKNHKFAFSRYCNEGTSFAGMSLGQFPFASAGFEEFQNVGIPQDTTHMHSRADSVSKSESLNHDSSTSQLCSIISLDTSFSDIQLHFHDTSCILATIFVPKSLSSFSYLNADSWDFLCSTNGITLTSTWPADNIHELLWGPSLESEDSVLSIRVTKEVSQELLRPTQISISFKNVTCILLSDFLSIATGYFKLHDWHSNAGSQCMCGDLESYNGVDSTVLYKFESLNSLMLLPVQGSTSLCLRVELSHLFGKFVPEMSDYSLSSDGPVFECLDVVHVVSKSASISILLLSEETNCQIKLDKHMLNKSVPYIKKLDANFQFLIPCKPNLPNNISIDSEYCDLVAEDQYFLLGRKTISNVLDQFASVKKDYRLYNANIMQYLQLKRNPEEHSDLVFSSSVSTINLSISTKKLLINFENITGAFISEKVACATLELRLSSVLVNEIPHHMDIEIASFVLQSSNCNVLVSFKTDGSLHSNLHVKFARSMIGEYELALSLPMLDIWLFLDCWTILVDHFSSYTIHAPIMSDSCGFADADLVTQGNPSFASSGSGQKEVNCIMICENATVSFHLPIWEKENQFDTASSEARFLKTDEKPNIRKGSEGMFIEQKHYKSVNLCVQCKYCKVTSKSSNMHVKCDFDRMKFALELCHENISIPFSLVSRVKANITLDQMQDELNLCMQAESVDVGLSHQIFSFWHNTELQFSEKKSSTPHYCVRFKFLLKKGSLLLRDGRSSSHGPVMETLMKNVSLQVFQEVDQAEFSASINFLVNYNNIDKVMWEPFIEPWSFHCSSKKCSKIVGDGSASFDVHIDSQEQLNFNISEPVIEAIVRLSEMIQDAWTPKNGDLLSNDVGIILRGDGEVHTRRYSPYIISNETSLPFWFKVLHCPSNMDDVQNFNVIDENCAAPGSTVPVFVEETTDTFFFQHRETCSSGQLIERKMNAMAHHLIEIQFEGTFGPSKPLSMDLVGINYFEVNLSGNKEYAENEVEIADSSQIIHKKADEKHRIGNDNECVVPVVFDVSLQHYSKKIRVYSTVILCNSTSVPLELQFDIPFGVSSKVIGPVFPNKEIPLPLHLSEAGLIRWHPSGTAYLWSKAHALSSLLSVENRPGFMKSFVCYPTHPSNDPFRCCISVEDYNVPLEAAAKKLKNYGRTNSQTSVTSQNGPGDVSGGHHFIRQVKLCTPFVVKNYLPTSMLLNIDCCGVPHQVSLPEAETASIYLVDSSSDLGITLNVEGYKSIGLRFPRAESFSILAKSNGFKFSQMEAQIFYSNSSNRVISINVEKIMDALCGARELVISVPFLLYNCTDLLLTIMENYDERGGTTHVIPPSFESSGSRRNLDAKAGLCLLSSGNLLSLHQSGNSNDRDLLYSTGKAGRSSTYEEQGVGRGVKPHMFSPANQNPDAELLIKLNVSLPVSGSEVTLSNWSSSFLLVPAGGSTNVKVPREKDSGAFLICVESIPLSIEFLGRTRAIAFQPRYVICNACSCDLFFRQKGTRTSYRLSSGQHSFLHSSDSTRELLVSIRFDGPGWQWSGSFPPDRLGDIQLKMRNNFDGALCMVRVEVQNADVANYYENISGKINSNSSTQLILLSDDRTEFVPYRIDNFSMEKLRLYQQRCEHLETIVYPYSSCQYAWDEPCYPRRLVIEVPGKKLLGTYSLETLNEYVHIDLPGNNERPEKKLCISIHAEGAMKVLSVIDSGSHTIRDLKETGFLGLKDNKDADRNADIHMKFSEIIKVHLPCIGVSLISSSPQELLYVSVKDTTIIAMQNINEQKVLLRVSSLQIDNQFADTPFPIMLSLDCFQRGKSNTFYRIKDVDFKQYADSISEPNADITSQPVLQFAAARWSSKDASFVSYQYINICVAPLCIELEERIILSVLELVTAVSCRLDAKRSEEDVGSVALDYAPNITVEYWRKVDYLSNSMLRNSIHVEDQRYNSLLPTILPFGAPWQQIFLLARRQQKLYVELFELAPIRLSLSFTSTPWINRSEAGLDQNGTNSVTAIQRGLMALIDVEDVPIHLGEVKLENLMASWQSIQDIFVKHYSRQLLHEIYKVFGSAGVIGNPVGFARNVGFGLRDFFNASSKGALQSPGGLLDGIGRGSISLFASTIYAISSATTHFSKTAHKGLVAFTYDDQVSSENDDQNKQPQLYGKGVLNGFFEGLTGLLQSPIRGVEKHGLPGIVSGITMGTVGLVARPMASILEATERTARSIRNKSNPRKLNRLRIRLPRPLAKEHPLMPYSWEEAIGASVLQQPDKGRFSDEIFVLCKALEHKGKFLVLSARLVLVVSSPWLVDLGAPNFAGIPPDPGWIIETEMRLECIIHLDRSGQTVNIVGSNTEMPFKGNRSSTKYAAHRFSASTPLFHVSIHLPDEEEAVDTLQVILSTIERGKIHRWNQNILHRRNIS